jgi:hypothetical protein
MKLLMVDQSARLLAARLLSDFLDGRITNDEYDNEFPSDGSDPGLKVIYRRVWFYYSDLESHYLNAQELSDEDVALFKRCIEFLKTELDYEGPPIRMNLPLGSLLRRLIGGPEPQSVLGSKATQDAIFFTEWWPFASADQREHALERIRASI